MILTPFLQQRAMKEAKPDSLFKTRTMRAVYLGTIWLVYTLLSPAMSDFETESRFKIKFNAITLKNGLRVLTVEDHSAPVIAVSVTYDVGSRNERKGQSGYAHLLEHMMFKGSENVGPGEHRAWIINTGGTMNAQTTEERTSYFEVLPANQLELVLFLEADRMRGLLLTTAHLDNQRDAVEEERRLRVDNQAYGKSWEVLQESLYQAFAYKHFGIGSMKDLREATVRDMQEFFLTYYAPNNAVLTLVGDFNAHDAEFLIRKYFDNIPRRPDPTPVRIREAEEAAAHRTTLEDPLAKAPRVVIGFKVMPSNGPDYYPFEVLRSVLLEGESSRLYQRLVRKEELLQSITAGPMRPWRAPNMFSIVATLQPGKSVQQVESVINEEVERLKYEPISDWELMKAKNSILLTLFKGLQTPQACAITLGDYAVLYNEPELINTRSLKLERVIKADVQRVANQYLSLKRQAIVIITPEASAQRGAPKPDPKRGS